MNWPWQFSSQLAISALSVFSASLVCNVAVELVGSLEAGETLEESNTFWRPGLTCAVAHDADGGLNGFHRARGCCCCSSRDASPYTGPRRPKTLSGQTKLMFDVPGEIAQIKELETAIGNEQARRSWRCLICLPPSSKRPCRRSSLRHQRPPAPELHVHLTPHRSP